MWRWRWWDSCATWRWASPTVGDMYRHASPGASQRGRLQIVGEEGICCRPVTSPRPALTWSTLVGRTSQMLQPSGVVLTAETRTSFWQNIPHWRLLATYWFSSTEEIMGSYEKLHLAHADVVGQSRHCKLINICRSQTSTRPITGRHGQQRQPAIHPAHPDALKNGAADKASTAI